MAGSSSKKITVKAITEAITITSVIASIAAIVHLYGVGLSARVNMLAYVGFPDYLKVTIGWIIPSIVPSLFVGYVVPSIYDIVKPVKDNNGDIEKAETIDDLYVIFKKIEKGWNNLFKAILIFTLFIIISCICFFIFIDSSHRSIFLFSTLIAESLWITFFVWYIKSIKNFIRLNKNIMLALLFLPILIIYSFGSGLAKGAIGKKTDRITINKIIVSTDNESIIYGELLFVFEKFIVIREVDNKELTFIAADSVKKIKTPAIQSSTPVQEKIIK